MSSVEAVKPPTRQADEERQFAALFRVENKAETSRGTTRDRGSAEALPCRGLRFRRLRVRIPPAAQVDVNHIKPKVTDFDTHRFLGDSFRNAVAEKHVDAILRVGVPQSMGACCLLERTPARLSEGCCPGLASRNIVVARKIGALVSDANGNWSSTCFQLVYEVPWEQVRYELTLPSPAQSKAPRSACMRENTEESAEDRVAADEAARS